MYLLNNEEFSLLFSSLQTSIYLSRKPGNQRKGFSKEQKSPTNMAMKNSNEKEKASSDFFTTWIDPPTSNNGKWRFIGIPYWICNNPGGDWVWGRPNLPPINIWKMVLANEPFSSHQLSNFPFGHFFSTNLPYQKKPNQPRISFHLRPKN